MCDLFGSSAPKVDPLPAAPAPTDPAVGDAELKRKRAAAAAFGRKSTIATSGMGDTSKGTVLGYGQAGGSNG
jgi:hypothetical protein